MIISIIIATYNADKTLKQCLLSIVSQKTEDIELIIIDAKSKDNTCEIVKSFGNKINYFVSEKDHGVYDAWNKGIKVANGQWVMFLGADDTLLPNAINTYLDYLQSIDSSSYDYISAQNEFTSENGRLLKIMGKGAEWNLLRNGMSAAHVGSLHNKKNLFGEVGLYNLNFKICSDYEMLVRKRENLKSGFLRKTIAQMKAGGMSFSSRAIRETYEVRKMHGTVPQINNLLLYLRDLLAYTLFRVRKLV